MSEYYRGDKGQKIVERSDSSFSSNCSGEFSQKEKEKIINDAYACISRFYELLKGEHE